jgi:hypothetical protein
LIFLIFLPSFSYHPEFGARHDQIVGQNSFPGRMTYKLSFADINNDAKQSRPKLAELRLAKLHPLFLQIWIRVVEAPAETHHQTDK